MTILSNLAPAEGATRKRKRVGRGENSGLGKTCGRGHKGQKSRSGGSLRPGFEGGQMPLQRRLPKKGFVCPSSKTVEIITLDQLAAIDQDGPISKELLLEKRIIRRKNAVVKVLNKGNLDKKVILKDISVSAEALKKIEAAGGGIHTEEN